VANPKPLLGPSSLYESPRFSTALGLVHYSQATQEALNETTILDRLRRKIGRFLPGL
jgi:hypothetical protein